MIAAGRPKLPLDGAWDFVPDPAWQFAPDTLPAGSPIFVPGAWEAQLPEPYGIIHGWYRRRFAIPAEWPAGTLLLRFGAAMTDAQVWLDGRLLGRDRDGYLPFEIDAGPAQAGAEHVLVVSVENLVNAITEYPAFGTEALQAARDRLGARSFEGLPHGKQTWYTSTSGLIASIVAELAPDPRFWCLVVVPDAESGRIVVRWRIAGTRPPERATVALTVISPAGDVTARATVAAGDGHAHLAVPDAERWDLWHPVLYQLDARLEAAGEAGEGGVSLAASVDDASVRFGMRSVRVDHGEIILNGRPIYLRGALDQDFWPDGRSNPPSGAALRDQVRLARGMGLNLLRCHLKIPDPGYLDAADEAGILVWCELPNWTHFEPGTALRARRMLARMVETMSHHPSIVAWTVINEDWGTDLRHSARDRRWLRSTAAWLKASDPNRLVVDNSACETPDGPNFHLRTDLADFHAYRSMPDCAPAWRALVSDFAERPSWLWSPHGDAAPTGNEALVLSEFGGWGLPRRSALHREGATPWWWGTGDGIRRPAGMQRRFEEQGLNRIWPDIDAMAVATQWRQFQRLAQQIRELRRHPSIKGYVITELSDGFWEPNGLLEVDRRPKAFHDRLAELNAPEVLLLDLPRSDLRGVERLTSDVLLSSFGDDREGGVSDRGRLTYELRLASGDAIRRSTTIERWPSSAAQRVGQIELDCPDVTEVTTGELVVSAETSQGDRRATYRQPVVVVPSGVWRTHHRCRIRVIDPGGRWCIAERLERMGHEVLSHGECDLIVSSRLDGGLLDEVRAGTPLLLLVREDDAIPQRLPLGQPLVVKPRHPGQAAPQEDRVWEGDWTSVFAWALPGVIPGLPAGGLLGDAQAEIFPDHVLDGLDVGSAADGVEAGLFAGWIHAPVALLATFAHGTGRLVVTTLRLAPEDGPVATGMFHSLIRRAVARAERPVQGVGTRS